MSSACVAARLARRDIVIEICEAAGRIFTGADSLGMPAAGEPFTKFPGVLVRITGHPPLAATIVPRRNSARFSSMHQIVQQPSASPNRIPRTAEKSPPGMVRSLSRPGRSPKSTEHGCRDQANSGLLCVRRSKGLHKGLVGGGRFSMVLAPLRFWNSSGSTTCPALRSKPGALLDGFFSDFVLPGHRPRFLKVRFSVRLFRDLGKFGRARS